MQGLTTEQLQREKDDALRFRERRHGSWTENYKLFRDRVTTNRLTQRQSVNVPLMKATLKTLMAKFSKPTGLYFDELGNDKQREIFKNEYWRAFVRETRLPIKERVDDLQVLLYGRTFQKLNVVAGKPLIEIIDPFDVLVDRYMDPADIETAAFVIHTGIFRRLADVERNALYDKAAVSKLRDLFATREGLVKADDNRSRMQERSDRLRAMGLQDVEFPQLSETYVELNEHQRKEWNAEKGEVEVIVYVTAEGETLTRKPLREILGVNFYTWESWASDVERTDFWSDGEADVVRGPNQVLNVWYSQLAENRTLRSFGMQYFDSTNENFKPQTFAPAPFGWYPVPGNPNDMVKRIEIPDLSESIDEMKYVTSLVEAATAASAIEKGTGTEKRITLGEVELLAANAMDRVEGIADLRLANRIALGEKWSKLVDANAGKLDAVKLYKRSASGNVYPRTVKATDWLSRSGYACRVTSEAENEEQTVAAIQKGFAMRQLFPGNAEFERILKERGLDLMGVSVEERQNIMEADKQVQPEMLALAQGGAQPFQQPAPVDPTPA